MHNWCIGATEPFYARIGLSIESNFVRIWPFYHIKRRSESLQYVLVSCEVLRLFNIWNVGTRMINKRKKRRKGEERRTILQLQPPATSHVRILPLLLQTLRLYINITWLIVHTVLARIRHCSFILLLCREAAFKLQENDPPAATPSDIPRLRPSSSPPNTWRN